jgi:small subunit ribosomal protein S16
MVRIRLMRVGGKGAPSYRVVIADSRSPRDGRIIENIGWYNPLTEPSTIQIDGERAKYWISMGAQPSDSVQSLLVRAGIVPKVPYTPRPEKAKAAVKAESAE